MISLWAFKGSQVSAFPIGIIVLLRCYLEFKVGYVKILKSFSIFGITVLRGKADGFTALFKAFFWEINLWVALGDFALKTQKIGKGNLHLKKMDFVETKFAVRKIITVLWVTCVHKNSQIRTLIKHLLTKYRFSRNCLKFHIFTKKKLKCNWIF